MSDVVTEGLVWLLSIVLEVLGALKAHVGVLKVPHEDLLQVRPILDGAGREVLQPCSGQVDQEQGEVADDEVVIIRAASLIGKQVVLKPKVGVRFLGVFEDVSQRSIPLWEQCVEDVLGESLRP
jgi:hypothetical protein